MDRILLSDKTCAENMK